MSEPVVVIGGGLAGCEAAYQLARAGVEVELYEMRPTRSTEAHTTDALSELVCSNSFRDDTLTTAVGVLKAEMRMLGSLIMRVADAVRVPAGSALAVDREGFARAVTAEIEKQPAITVVRREMEAIPERRIVIVASGPLTSPALSDALARFVGSRHLYFYDAISPIVTAESIDMNIAYRAARYGKGGDDYINCPLNKEQYERLIDEILAAETMALKSFERCLYFEGCMPIEELARRGRDTLRFGPMKPVGLEDPRTGKMPHAVVQLRQDDREGRLYSMVGFQTKMKYPEQRRVFRMIPGLEHAEFVRLGSLHRNTFINSPRILTPTLTVIGKPSVFIAGQLVGVEGYVESAATGLLCGINAARLATGKPLVVPPRTTALGSLIAYVTDRSRKNFQPMNANFGLFPPLERRLRGLAKKQALADRALAELRAWMIESGIGNPDAVLGASRC
ncbi:MAG: methylenetetrahydrofolate--tRNA-(uracil(54)-C(5))-methyltransferase (FADH(2)-oxidizing) TrmFO [Candidatus Dadabacteria bacterium]|nr:MAG: methylenetetrahydrofolate--tRNA-(uracil(54)-C(5))-methyltransferase (FADH(2)-oxidizing) TrmFO [Candidatus Dadabacteria bacterium]